MNTKPMLVGLEQAPLNDQIELLLEFPSRLVPMLRNGEIDVALLPVAALNELPTYHIVSEYCISTEDEVASVALFSQVPMEEIETVILDYQSRTSVMLCKLLFKKYWKKEVKFIVAEGDDYFEQISGRTAGLIIGDRALKFINKSTYLYDLGAAWKSMTGMPFVFAVWVSVNQLPEAFVSQFNKANGVGVSKIDDVIKSIDFPEYDLAFYYKHNMSYSLTDIKRNAIKLYLSEIRDL